MKYRPEYPHRFGSLADARSWAGEFFRWYNHDHQHSALALLTPAPVHYGQAQTVLGHRQQVLQAAYQAHPERFVGGVPKPPQLPQAVWINQPKSHGLDVSQEIFRPESTQPLELNFFLMLSQNA